MGYGQATSGQLSHNVAPAWDRGLKIFDHCSTQEIFRKYDQMMVLIISHPFIKADFTCTSIVSQVNLGYP